MRLFIPALLTLLAGTCSFQAQTVGPLGLGMTAAQAAQALGPSYKDTLRLRGAGAGLVVHTFTKANDEYSVQTMDDKVFYIGHSVLFEIGAQPGLEDTKRRLLEKYGAPSKAGGNGDQITWEFDKTGARLPVASQCFPRIPIMYDTTMYAGGTQASLGYVSGVEAAAPCFTHVKAHLNAVLGKDFLQGLSIELWNVQAYLERLRGLDRASQQKQQQQDDAVRKASKAPL